MRGYLDRPIGETVVRLCAAMGLDPEACQPDGETWRVRRAPLDFELRLEERRANTALLRLPFLPPLLGRVVLMTPTGAVESAHFPTLDAPRPVPPHKGEGGRAHPLTTPSSIRLFAVATIPSSLDRGFQPSMRRALALLAFLRLPSSGRI